MKSALKKVSLILAICFVAFHLYTAAFGTMPGIAQKSIHLGFLLVIFYINAMVDSEKRWEQIFLGIMALFALGGCAYITILDENLQLRAGIVYASDILFAILLIIAIFEACRRKMGNPLVIITLVFVAYAFLGKYIPGFLNQPGMTLKKFTSLVYLTTDGIFGSPLYASASYVVLFVLLGAIMSVSGIGDYMTNLATSLFGHMRGGPAKVAVVASGFFGSISGSPTANVIGTGTFTIPMMKKNGFEPEFAAAVEATASTGGAIMPPIMGSTAFNPFLCLSDFVRPLSSGIPDTVGAFATTIDENMEQPFEGDDYKLMLVKTLGERLAEAAAEKVHETIRKSVWGYAKDEHLTMKQLLNEDYQGIRPAVGYPSLPDISVSFLLDELLDMKRIGIKLTENGMMQPHASVCGLMFAHPASRYFSVGKIDEEQLADYAARRGCEVSEIRKYLVANLQQ